MAKDEFVDLEQDDNLKSSTNSARASRDFSDVQRQDTDGTVATRSERRKQFLSEWQQNALPTPPEVPGFHLCWLSTTNSYDPIHKRIRLGYEPVKPSDVPGFDAYNLKGGEWKGFIGANEMILFKIPNEKYQDIMEELHYHQPLDEEAAIKNSLSQQRDSNGKSLGMIEGDGIADFGTPIRTPKFT
jgi:hypothetical protein